MKYEYFVVPFVGQVNEGDPKAAETAAAQLQDLLNHYGDQGVEFHGQCTIEVIHKPGCLAALFGGSPKILSYNKLVFKRQIQK